jgi:hypothetical protein
MPFRTVRWTSLTAGRARRVDDPAVRQVVYTVYTATGAFTSDDTLFELYWSVPRMPNMGCAELASGVYRVVERRGNEP